MIAVMFISRTDSVVAVMGTKIRFVNNDCLFLGLCVHLCFYMSAYMLISLLSVIQFIWPNASTVCLAVCMSAYMYVCVPDYPPPPCLSLC